MDKRISILIEKWQTKSVIFDLDGTLVNTLDQHISAFEILFKENNIEIPRELIIENMGRTPKDILLTLIPELKTDPYSLEKYAKHKEAIFSQLLKEIPLLPGTIQLLSFLNNLHITLCLASSTTKTNVNNIIDTIHIRKFFKVIITGEEVTIGKPNPEIFLLAQIKAQVKPSQCIVIGDSIFDIQAAKKGKMKIISVCTGKHKESELQKWNPNLIINTLEDLIK